MLIGKIIMFKNFLILLFNKEINIYFIKYNISNYLFIQFITFKRKKIYNYYF